MTLPSTMERMSTNPSHPHIHTKTIAFQGIPGSFSHITATALFSADNKFNGTRKFSEIFSQVSSKAADYGVVPLENTLAGSIYESYDLLAQHDLHIVDEYCLAVGHHLLVKNAGAADDPARLAAIRRVLSHPKALEQCRRFFEKHPNVELEVASDTASAARRIASDGDESLAAIASLEAAKLYGLRVLAKNIEDDPNNLTRFGVIAREETSLLPADKCSLLFTLPHAPRSLCRALELVGDANFNLTKIESRPIHGKPFEYLFYIDFQFDSSRPEAFKQFLDDFRGHALNVRLLGCYSGYRKQ